MVLLALHVTHMAGGAWNTIGAGSCRTEFHAFYSSTLPEDDKGEDSETQRSCFDRDRLPNKGVLGAGRDNRERGDFGRDASQQRSPVQVDVRNLNSQPKESEATLFSRAVVHRQRFHGLPLVSA